MTFDLRHPVDFLIVYWHILSKQLPRKWVESWRSGCCKGAWSFPGRNRSTPMESSPNTKSSTTRKWVLTAAQVHCVLRSPLGWFTKAGHSTSHLELPQNSHLIVTICSNHLPESLLHRYDHDFCVLFMCCKDKNFQFMFFYAVFNSTTGIRCIAETTQPKCFFENVCWGL